MFLNYLKISVSHDANGQSNIKTKRKKRLFFVFFKMSVTWCGRPDRPNKVKKNIFYF